MQRVVICGDSTATPFGLTSGDSHEAFPQLLRRALKPSGTKVITTAKSGTLILDTLDKLDRVVAANPTMVVLAHGGRECLFGRSKRLNLIWTDPDAPIPAGLISPLRYCKRALYRGFLALLKTRLAPTAARAVGAKTHMDPFAFERNLVAVVGTLLDRTNAEIILVVPSSSRMTIFPWSEPSLARVRQSIRNAASTSTRIRLLDLTVDPYSAPENFQRDGVHRSAVGHERVSHALTAHLSALHLATDSRRRAAQSCAVDLQGDCADAP